MSCPRGFSSKTLLSSTFSCMYLGKFELSLLCFYFINILQCRSSVTYTGYVVVLLYWSRVWWFWLLLKILACLMAEPCCACGGHREECIPSFFTCTFIFMSTQTDVLVLTVVVLLGFCRAKYNWHWYQKNWGCVGSCHTHPPATSCKSFLSQVFLLFLDFPELLNVLLKLLISMLDWGFNFVCHVK